MILDNVSDIFFSKIWRDIPDVQGRWLSEAKPTEEGGCALSPSIKYKPGMVKTDRDIEVGKNRHLDLI